MKGKNDKPSQAEFGQLVSYLASKQKFKPNQIKDSIGITPNGKNWGEISDSLKGWLNAPS